MLIYIDLWVIIVLWGSTLGAFIASRLFNYLNKKLSKQNNITELKISNLDSAKEQERLLDRL